MECPGCGSAMREDQRICLQCGELAKKRVAPSERLQAVPAGVPGWIAFEADNPTGTDLPASRVSRILAALVDGVLWGVLGTVAFSQFGTEPNYNLNTTEPITFADFGIPLWLLVSVLVAQAVYYIAFPATAWQGTPGKKLLGLRITNLEGERISIFQAFFRYLCFSVFWWLLVPLLMFVGIFVLAVPVAVLWLMGDGRSPWDSMAGTKVVD